ncbi:putative FBD-associated F-box protein At1g61330 [Mercurialis annua]|uniref:putative FBD-associated F-box protein At1g61330 n=1 Tax=Mercurialis annua TaxID=3986 RepID=UPI00215FA617|nr:putative FBD-associated F-box protein At1g61330 [Mercurialis annua]
MYICVNLITLTLNYFLTIDAPTLQLSDVLFYFRRSSDSTASMKVFYIVKNVSLVRVLTITSVFLEGLSSRIQSGEWRGKYHLFQNLKELQVVMAESSSCNPIDIAVFVKSCPSLEKLLIELDENSVRRPQYPQDYHRKMVEEYNLGGFPNLKFVKLSKFRFQQHELKFAQIFVENAINLEKLIFVSAKSSGATDFNTARQYSDILI